MQDTMDRRLKERVIGAAVLVGVAVLVVPVFLDGPSDEPEMLSTAVALPGQNAQQSTMQTIVLNRDRKEPVPPSTPPAAQSNPEPVKVEPAQSKPAPKKATPAPSQNTDKSADVVAVSQTGMWAVQLGSFSNEQNAERLAADLRKQGYAAFLSRVDTGNGGLHRVRVGPQKDRDSAESMAARLKQAGHSGQVVTHP